MTPEEYIKAYTRGCSNELIAVESRAGKEVISYHEWLTPENALAAVELAREEMKEPASEDLEEAAEECVDGEDYPYTDGEGMPLYTPDYLTYMFRQGAQWQKEQMMKDAMEGYVSATICLAKHCPQDIAEIQVRDSKTAANVGEKVKIIIIKE